MRELPVVNRACGPCSLCCTTLGVPEIGKPENQRCDHITNGRCGIYADRPESCRSFRCRWLAGIVPAHLRPDKSRVVVDANRTGDMLVLHIHPRDEGAHQRAPFADWLTRITQTTNVIVVCGTKRSLLGPMAREYAAGRTGALADVLEREAAARDAQGA